MSRVEVSGSTVTRVLLRVVYRGSTPRLGQRLIVDGGVLGGRRLRSTVAYDAAAGHVARMLSAVDVWAREHGERALLADGCTRGVGRVRLGCLTGSRPDAHYLLAEIEQRISE